MTVKKSENVKNAWKYICQIRSQIDKNRTSLILGSGTSIDLKLPMWKSLIQSIKDTISTNIPEAEKVNDAPGKAALILFEMFSSYKSKDLSQKPEYKNIYITKKKILSEWRELIHSALYKNITPNNRLELINSHPYFRQLIKIATKSEITINYNFDDFIEYGLSQENLNPTKNERPYQTVWSHHSQFTKEKCVIYHPNGFLPFDSKKFQSENLVFSDGSFADQLLEGITGSLSTLLHVLTKKTSILIGHSLTDSTLLHLLRKAASISPGNYNYFISYTETEIPANSKKAIFEANFNNYNLITLFFNNHEISEFLDTITKPEIEFIRESDILGLHTKYTYYLVGSIGIGKSTALSQFGSLTTLDEWFDERPSEMAQSPETISTEKTITIDDWVNSQFGKKNNYLKEKQVGLFLVDRAPLDPLTFIVKLEQPARAKSMIQKGIRPGKSKTQVEPGEIIHMKGDPEEIWTRLITKRKETSWPITKIQELQQKSESLYSALQPHTIYATQKNETDVIRDIAKVIFSQNYEPKNIDAHLCEIADEK